MFTKKASLLGYRDGSHVPMSIFSILAVTYVTGTSENEFYQQLLTLNQAITRNPGETYPVWAYLA